MQVIQHPEDHGGEGADHRSQPAIAVRIHFLQVLPDGHQLPVLLRPEVGAEGEAAIGGEGKAGQERRAGERGGALLRRHP